LRRRVNQAIVSTPPELAFLVMTIYVLSFERPHFPSQGGGRTCPKYLAATLLVLVAFFGLFLTPHPLFSAKPKRGGKVKKSQWDRLLLEKKKKKKKKNQNNLKKNLLEKKKRKITKKGKQR
jgi:hypothetical protein